jgi:hypothetical protein
MSNPTPKGGKKYNFGRIARIEQEKTPLSKRTEQEKIPWMARRAVLAAFISASFFVRAVAPM